MDLLVKGKGQVGRVLAKRRQPHQDDAKQEARQDLQEYFGATGHAQVLTAPNLLVVVPETDRGKGQRHTQNQPDEQVGQVRPQQCGNNDTKVDQHAAHGRRPRLALVGLRTLLADELAYLEFLQLLDDPRTEHQREDQRGKAGVSRAESDVPKEVEKVDVAVKLEVEVVKHSPCVVACQRIKRFPTLPPQRLLVIIELRYKADRTAEDWSNSVTFSKCTPREPFTRTTSPGCMRVRQNSPA